MSSTKEQRFNNNYGNPAQARGSRTTSAANQLASLPANSRSNLSGRDLVMLEFQRSAMELTRNFLESQQRVMLAYLNKAQFSGADTNLRADYAGVREQVLAEAIQHNFTQQEFTHVAPLAAERQMDKAEDPRYDIAELPAISNGSRRNPAGETRVLLPAAVVADLTPRLAENLPLAALEDSSGAVTVGDNRAVPADQSSRSADELIEALINIVSERTGYPPEMLDPALDLEADLGIDSIKRVEILNSFRRLLPEEKQNALEDGIERLAGVKTLQGIMDWIKSELNPSASRNEGQTELDSVVLMQSADRESTLMVQQTAATTSSGRLS